MFGSNLVKRGVSRFTSFTKRFYAKGQEPNVFLNKHTKVICQGITGKHVGLFVKAFRELSILKGLLNMVPTW